MNFEKMSVTDTAKKFLITYKHLKILNPSLSEIIVKFSSSDYAIIPPESTLTFLDIFQRTEKNLYPLPGNEIYIYIDPLVFHQPETIYIYNYGY